ncbi:Uncharacterised protein [Bordetella pertussis]|nr:Uncharacterised protein [Bordetella pertussis]
MHVGGKRVERVRAHHQELADGDVDHPRGLVDDHESQRRQRIQRAAAQAGQRHLQEEQGVHQAACAASRRRSSPTSPAPR